MRRTVVFLLLGTACAVFPVSCGSGSTTAPETPYVSAFFPAEVQPGTSQFLLTGVNLLPAGTKVRVRCTCPTGTPFNGGLNSTLELLGTMQHGGGMVAGSIPDPGQRPHEQAFTTTVEVTYDDGTPIPSAELVVRFAEVPNRPCMDRPDTYTAPIATPLSVPAATGVLANSHDPDGDALTATIDTPPAHGSATLQPDGSFLYVPDPGYAGMDTFTYRVSDGYGTSPPMLVTVYVGSGVWVTRPSMPIGRSGFVAEAVGANIYVVGGSTLLGDTAACDAFDTATGLWTPRAPMSSPRRHAASAVVGSELYVFGGLAAAGSNSVESYNPATDTWAPRAPMPAGRHTHAAVAVGTKIYVLGGYGPPVTQVDVYDVITDTWTTSTTAWLRGRTWISNSAVAFDGKIYVLGGSSASELDWCDAYDPAADTWAALPPLPMPVSTCVAGVLRGRVHAAGGWHGGPLGLHASHAPGSTGWLSRPPLPTPRNDPAGVVVNDTLYVLGGTAPTSARSTKVESIWYAPNAP